MDIDETMVENEFDEAEAEDSLPEGLVEDAGEPEDDGSEPLIEEEEPTAEEQPEEAPQGTGEREPGYVKRRIDKAVAKAVAETEARMNAKFEAMMAPILEKQMEDAAQELVRSRKVSDIETARELVRLRQGMPAQQAQPTPGQPRNSKGQFTANESDPATEARINMLKHQADRIKASKGIDVIAEFNRNEDIRNKVKNGEMDFYDVAEGMKKPAARKKPPAPMRSPNGVSGTTPNAIDMMSDEEFDRLNKRLKEGARIRQTW